MLFIQPKSQSQRFPKNCSSHYAHLLPESIRRFTLPQEIHDADHLSFLQGGGHGGSHPHLVHEFVTSILADRDPWPNALTSANWTSVGICAHESALKGGEIIQLPEFTLPACSVTTEG